MKFPFNRFDRKRSISFVEHPSLDTTLTIFFSSLRTLLYIYIFFFYKICIWFVRREPIDLAACRKCCELLKTHFIVGALGNDVSTVACACASPAQLCNRATNQFYLRIKEARPMHGQRSNMTKHKLEWFDEVRRRIWRAKVTKGLLCCFSNWSANK